MQEENHHRANNYKTRSFFFSKLFVYFVDLDVSVVDEFERREWTESASC